jgi:D-alanine transaminase
MPTTLACLDGELMPADQAKVPIWDRGFLFGDSVYEVLRLYSGRMWLEDAHFLRLRRSLGALEMPAVDLDDLKDRVHRTIRASNVSEGTVYIQITRGVAPRTHAFPAPPVPPTQLIVVRPYDDGPTAQMRDQGVALISLPDQRWGRCDVKSTNLLANVLANEAAHRAGAYEAVLISDDGLVSEATHSSVLWVRDNRLGGTPEGPAILPGTTRGHILKLAALEGIPFAPGRISLTELATASEILLVGTTIEVLPVIALDGAPIGDGQPGPIARRLQQANQASVRAWLSSRTTQPGA